MSSRGDRGLGEFQFNRDEAAQQLYRGSAAESQQTASDQQQQKRENDSEHASNSATVDVDPLEEDEVTTPTVESAPAPPPAKSPEARVQFNNRIKPDRRHILDRYQRRHNTTMQAIVDQMVDEYLERRGLMSKDKNDE